MKMTEELEGENYRIPDSTRFSAYGTILGMVAVSFMVIASFAFPEGASNMDQAQPVADFIARAGTYTSEITLILILDTIFLVGYTSLFIGLWLIVRDFSEIMSKVGLVTGLLVGFFDIVENTLLIVVVNGLQTGWQPDDRIYASIFLLNTFIDLLSYAAGLIYAIIFLAVFKPWDRKFFLGLLLVLYVIIGLLSLVIPVFYLIRSLFFVIGLVVGGVVLYKEEDIPLELLLKMVEQQKETKGDFV